MIDDAGETNTQPVAWCALPFELHAPAGLRTSGLMGLAGGTGFSTLSHEMQVMTSFPAAWTRRVTFSDPIDISAALERHHIEFLTVSDQRYFAIYQETVFDCRDPAPDPHAATTLTVHPVALPDGTAQADEAAWEDLLDAFLTAITRDTSADVTIQRADSNE